MRHSPKARKICGVFIPERNGFCDLPVSGWYRRCDYHTNALRQDSLFETLRRMKAAQRNIALDVLDAVQKKRPHWEYLGDEESLIREQEAKDQAKKK